MKNVQNIKLPPYGELRVEGHRTFALISGDAQYIYLRTGSDAIRVQMAQCLPVSHEFAMIVNPYPRSIDVIIGRGFELAMSIENIAPTLAQITNLQSYLPVYRAAQVSGLKYAVGIMLNRGSGILEIVDAFNDTFSSVMVFPNATKQFLSLKPVGCMTDNMSMRFLNGDSDDAVTVIGGTYSDQMVSDWVSAAGYSGQFVWPWGNHLNNYTRFVVDEKTAVFFVRAADKTASASIRLLHRGVGLENFR